MTTPARNPTFPLTPITHISADLAHMIGTLGVVFIEWPSNGGNRVSSSIARSATEIYDGMSRQDERGWSATLAS